MFLDQTLSRLGFRHVLIAINGRLNFHWKYCIYTTMQYNVRQGHAQNSNLPKLTYETLTLATSNETRLYITQKVNVITVLM